MSLETHRLKDDLIEVFKLIHGYNYVDQEMFIIMRPRRLDRQSNRDMVGNGLNSTVG